MKVSFVHNGNCYSGEIISDTRSQPFMYWFLFNMNMEFSNGELAYALVKGELVSLQGYIDNPELVTSVKFMIEKQIKLKGACF